MPLLARGGSIPSCSLVVEALRALTTKDTKVHEGRPFVTREAGHFYLYRPFALGWYIQA